MVDIVIFFIGLGLGTLVIDIIGVKFWIYKLITTPIFWFIYFYSYDKFVWLKNEKTKK